MVAGLTQQGTQHGKHRFVALFGAVQTGKLEMCFRRRLFPCLCEFQELQRDSPLPLAECDAGDFQIGTGKRRIGIDELLEEREGCAYISSGLKLERFSDDRLVGVRWWGRALFTYAT